MVYFKKMLCIVSVTSVMLLSACGTGGTGTTVGTPLDTTTAVTAPQTTTGGQTTGGGESTTGGQSTGGGESTTGGQTTGSGESTTGGGSTQALATGHGEMEHDESGRLPEGVKKAENPAFQEGSNVVLRADHMPGMEGAKGTVVGAFDTVAYAVSFIPTTGGEPQKNHKWVIHEELDKAGEDRPLEAGAKVVLKARHMPGMEGAEATIDSAQATTVYMVDFQATDTGETIRNHQWLTEDELSASE